MAIEAPAPDHSSSERKLRADTLAASVVILLLVTLLQRSVGFGRGVLFCRWLDPDALGQWEMALSFLMLGAPLAVWGIPGSFGRYAEHYRARGQLRTFLVRTGVWTLGFGATAVLGTVAMAPEFSQLIFGHPDNAALVCQIGVCLGGVIVHHTLTSLLTALRLFRVVSAMSFAHSLLFALISLSLLWKRPTALSIVQGYGAACWLTSLGALAWTWPALGRVEQTATAQRHGEFWPRLLRFALAIWAVNLFANLFAVVDRYMLVHHAGMTADEAIVQVGIYHSSRVIPVMLISFADLLGALIMPHLTYDWENGRRALVAQRLSLAIKLTGWGLIVFSAIVLASGPLLFSVLLQGRYDAGLTVLPWTLAACAWYGMNSVAQNYLWCTERTGVSAVPWLAGLTLNVGLNLLLLPIWGLYGAVLATAISTLLCVGVLFVIGRLHGMHIDRGTVLVLVFPLALGGGVWWAALAAAALSVFMFTTHWILTIDERRQLQQVAARLMERISRSMPALLRRKTASVAPH